jgi:hypothetical protein
MNTRHSRRISRKAAEQLLDGAAGLSERPPAGPDQLISVLAAAAAPAREHELTGEDMAVAAFEANHLASVASSRREQQMIKSPLAKLLTIKVLAASLVVGAGGGVALAASTGTFSGSASGRPSVSTSLAPASAGTQPTATAPATSPSGSVSPSSPAAQSAAGTGQATASPSATGTASAQASVPQTATALCRAVISGVSGTAGQALSQAGQVQALASSQVPQLLNQSEFSSLIGTVQSAAAVPDYCALLLDLPQLPQPAELTQLPVTVLTKVLAQVPTATLAQLLTSLPSSTLSALLTELPTSTVSQLLTELPGSVVTQLLNELPTSVVSQLLTELPNSVVSNLSGLSGLSSSVLSLLPGL